jgi:hypothetical protein
MGSLAGREVIMNSNHSEAGVQVNTTTLVDAHVHIHDCFGLADFLTAASRNFAAAAAARDLNADYRAVLCLTETCHASKFEMLRGLADGSAEGHELDSSSWRVHATDEPVSVVVENPEFGRVHIIAGRQIVVAERLEVLALGCVETWPDGLPASEVIDGVAEAGSIAVLPWGFGKWLGRRGRTLRSLLEAHHRRHLFLGDNSGRPVFFSEPHEFKLGRRLGLEVLPGTDPLPFASEIHRVGSFGCLLECGLGDANPWKELYCHLVQPGLSIRRFGRLETPLRFLRNQLAMQYAVRMGAGR